MTGPAQQRCVSLDRLDRQVHDLVAAYRDGEHHGPGLLQALRDPDVWVLRRTGGHVATRRSPKAGRVPISLEASDLLRAVETGTYEHDAALRDLLDAHLDDPVPWADLLARLPGLARAVPEAADDPIVHALADDVLRWRGSARQLLGFTGRDLGDSTCPACGARSYVTAGGPDDEGYCLGKSCSRRPDWDTMPSGLLDTAAACLLVGIAPATLRDWKRRHLIRPAGGSVRKPLWDTADLRTAARTTKTSARTPGPSPAVPTPTLGDQRD